MTILQRLATFSALGLARCTTPETSAVDAAAIQVAAATHIVGEIASNPGGITTVCVSYGGAWSTPRLPALEHDTVRVLDSDGCEEVAGVLRDRDEGGQAISARVGIPKMVTSSRAEVRVITSTGSFDVAAYQCALKREEALWTTKGCELEAIS